MQITVAGAIRDIDVKPDVPLPWFLRDGPGIAGPETGCGIGPSGTCNIHVDALAVRACQIAAGAVECAAHHWRPGAHDGGGRLLTVGRGVAQRLLPPGPDGRADPSRRGRPGGGTPLDPPRAIARHTRNGGADGREGWAGARSRHGAAVTFGVVCAQIVEMRDTTAQIGVERLRIAAEAGRVLDLACIEAQHSGGELCSFSHPIRA